MARLRTLMADPVEGAPHPNMYTSLITIEVLIMVDVAVRGRSPQILKM